MKLAPSPPAKWRLRPSAAPAWVRCAGSVRLSAGRPDEGDTTIREQGTAAHWAAFEKTQGRIVAVGDVAPNGVEITDEMLDGVAIYHAAVAAWNTDAVRYYETELHCAGIHPECGGTADVFAWCPTTATAFVGDFKFGFRYVDAYENWQMLCYLDGVLRFFYVQPQDVRRVVFMICQPRSYGRQTVRTWETTMPVVEALWKVLRDAAAATLAPQAVCVTNPGCLTCAGVAVCRASQLAALDVIERCHDATPEDLEFPAAENELRMLEWARDVVEARITGLSQEVERGIKAGAISRHFALQPTQSNLKWKEGAESKVLAIAQVLGKNVTKPQALITPTQAAKIIGEEFVNMHAQRLPTGTKLVQSDAKLWRRIFGKK